ncbi:MAG: FAD-dependent oxidoreductase [Clostridia bacterium]|nr:FAD-dependent oxidoreductase [Clostridia bacterium]
MTDILIIGGGTAGLTAGIYAARAGKSATILEKAATGGQIVYSPMVENYPGIPGISGAEYSERLTAQAEALGVAIEYDEAYAADRTADGFAVTGDMGTYEAKALILATGTVHRDLGATGEEELVGCGVSYCAVCDGAFYNDRAVAVVGGGNTALQDALFLAETCKSVAIVHRRDTFRGEAKLVKQLAARPNVRFVLNSTVTALHTEGGELSAITVKDTVTGNETELPVAGVFVAVGQLPQTDAFRTLTETDDAGYFVAGEDCTGTVPGVFVAGDCRAKEVRQLTTAAADGAIAALAACRYVDGL